MYIDPTTVTSPKANFDLGPVLHNTGDDGYSVARGRWDNQPCVVMRWNGSAKNPDGVGSPQSRGYPTWFVIPSDMEAAVLRSIPETDSVLACKIERPEGYDYGAWKITVELSAAVMKERSGAEVAFDLPNLPERICMPEKGYRVATVKGFKAITVKGRWEGDLYSNGVAEDKNVTSVDAYREALIHNIRQNLPEIGPPKS